MTPVLTRSCRPLFSCHIYYVFRDMTTVTSSLPLLWKTTSDIMPNIYYSRELVSMREPCHENHTCHIYPKIRIFYILPYEPQREKMYHTTCTQQTLISLPNCTVQSEPLLPVWRSFAHFAIQKCAQWKFQSDCLSLHWAYLVEGMFSDFAAYDKIAPWAILCGSTFLAQASLNI